MIISQIAEVIEAKVLTGEDMLNAEISSVCGADLMSDVLAFTKERTLLLTGLTNIQTIRTAEMLDLAGIVYVRGKRPGPDVIRKAEEDGLPTLVTSLPLYEACGRLYKLGLKGCSEL